MNTNKLKPHKRQLVQRFRRLIRTVIMNLSWLVDTTDQKFSMNVKKNIDMIVRVSKNIGFLTIKEKTLIRTPHKIRSVEDRKTLVKLLLGLQCFTQIPPKIRARLVPVVNFLIVPNGRIIIKEGHPAEFVYFILTGEVLCTHKEYDQTEHKYIDKILSVCIPGDCIGDIELIDGKRRQCSYTANSEVELLVVQKESFDRILLPYMKKRWLELKNAVMSLGYLNFFTEFQIFCACKFGTIHQYEALQKIYSDDKGKLGFTYFVLSGECTIMQNLKIKVTDSGEQKNFELVSIYDDEDEISGALDDVDLLRIIKEKELRLNQTTIESDFDLSVDDDENKKMPTYSSDIRKTYVKCAKYNEKLDSSKSTSSSIHSSSIDNYQYEDDICTDNQIVPSFAVSSPTEFSTEPQNEAPAIEQPDLQPRESSFLSLIDELEDHMSQYTYRDKRFSSTELFKIENHFIEVGTIGPGGVFGLGEELKQRIICASNTLQCLVLPRFWLFEAEQNPQNIWQTRKFHLENTIPSRDKLFHLFMKTRQWKKIKNNYIQSILDEKALHNCAKVQDIPAVCRILEGREDL